VTPYVLGIIAVTCLGFAKGGFVGIGLAATPILMLALPPLDAVAVLVPVMAVQDVFSVWVYRREYDRRNLMVMLPGVAIGVALAWTVVVHASYVQLLVGLTLAGVVLVHWLAPVPRRPLAALGVLWGTASGFAGLMANAGSVGFLAYVLPQRLPPVVYAGTMAFFFAAVDLAKFPPLLAMEQFTSENLVRSAVLMPLALVANMAGVALVRRISSRLFYRVAYVLVLMISLILIAQSLGAQ
jgi:uncharacterized membrane protein YfcA